MTISYTREVATCKGLGVFWKILFRWKGSIYKLVLPNLATYSVFYFALSVTYRFALNEYGREKFEEISKYCDQLSTSIPLTFVLGFYVSIIITRWWAQYNSLPWPDSCCLFISTCLQGQDERSRLMRRTIVRYLVVAQTQVLRMISIKVKKRFPTLHHLTEAGLITDNEEKIIQTLDDTCMQHPKYWLSLVWAGAILTRAKKEGKIKDDYSFNSIIHEINKFRGKCGGLLDYDWISVPLVYTQVVTLAVYTFFAACLMGRQFLNPELGIPGHEVDLVIPFLTFAQFFFYMGWLKVAEVFINPFGEDDDDFEVNWLIDRNLQVAYLIVDEMHSEHPELVKDQYWEEGVPEELPYTIAAEHFRKNPLFGSVANVEVPQEEQEMFTLERIDENEGFDEEEDKIPTIKIDEISANGDVNSNERTRRRTSSSSARNSLGSLRRNSIRSALQSVHMGAIKNAL